MNFEEDVLSYVYGMTPAQVTDCLTIDTVVEFLHSFGITQLDIRADSIVCPTYCHNKLDEDASMKLYWYQNHKIFHCYTECNENITIFDLYRKIMALNFHEVSFEEALFYVKNFLSKTDIKEQKIENKLIIPGNRFSAKKQLTECKEYPKTVLDCFLPDCPAIWKREGISEEAMKKFDIRYSIGQGSIIIPCYDLKHRLIGIRCRELEKERLKDYGKYHPVILGNEQYSFPSSQTLYGIYENQDALRRIKRAIIVEGEKSVMKGCDFFGDDNIVVASLGINNFGFYQMNLLTRVLGVNEIVIAYDKEYDNPNDEEGKKWHARLKEECKQYNSFADFSFIFDKQGLLQRKDSPLDRGKDIFMSLYKNRERVR